MLTQDQFLQHIKDFPADRKKMKDGWVEIDNIEYSFSPAFGGERINVLWRKSGQEQKTYSILMADDFDRFF